MGGYGRPHVLRPRRNLLWSYRDYPLPGPALPEKVQPCHVKRDGSVFEVIKDWNRRYKDAGRAIEICARVAKICASIDGRAIIFGKDLEKIESLLLNQIAIRMKFPSNPGTHSDATYSNAADNWLSANANGAWVPISTVKRALHTYEMKLGPNVANRALQALAAGDRVDIWWAKRKEENNPAPPDWVGPRPRLGLIRRRR